jgi:hypothetical protein
MAGFESAAVDGTNTRDHGLSKRVFVVHVREAASEALRELQPGADDTQKLSKTAGCKHRLPSVLAGHRGAHRAVALRVTRGQIKEVRVSKKRTFGEHEPRGFPVCASRNRVRFGEFGCRQEAHALDGHRRLHVVRVEFRQKQAKAWAQRKALFELFDRHGIALSLEKALPGFTKTFFQRSQCFDEIRVHTTSRTRGTLAAYAVAVSCGAHVSGASAA